MQLVLDIGNSGTKYGVFDEREPVGRGRLDSESEQEFEKLIDEYEIEHIMLSAVSQIPSFLLHDRQIETTLLQSSTELPIENKHLSATLGTDRIAAVVGAHILYPEVPKLIVDSGTCITFDVIDSRGKYLGGVISPGLRMRYRSMAAFTEKLIEVEPPEKWALYSENTREAIQLGGLNGLLMEIEGYYYRLKERWSDITLVLTGGDAGQFVEHLKMEIFVRPNLVLLGLNEILLYNE